LQLLCPSGVDSLVQLPRLSFPPSLALCCTPKSGVVGLSLRCQPAAMMVASPFRTKGQLNARCSVGHGLLLLLLRAPQVQALFVARSPRPTSPFRPSDTRRVQSAFMGKVASSTEEGRKGGPGLGLSNNNAASEHDTDVRQTSEWPWRSGAVGPSVFLDIEGRRLVLHWMKEERMMCQWSSSSSFSCVACSVV